MSKGNSARCASPSATAWSPSGTSQVVKLCKEEFRLLHGFSPDTPVRIDHRLARETTLFLIIKYAEELIAAKDKLETTGVSLQTTPLARAKAQDRNFHKKTARTIFKRLNKQILEHKPDIDAGIGAAFGDDGATFASQMTVPDDKSVAGDGKNVDTDLFFLAKLLVRIIYAPGNWILNPEICFSPIPDPGSNCDGNRELNPETGGVSF